MTYDLKFTLLWERASKRMLLMSASEKQLQLLPRWFRYGLSWSSYDLRPKLYLPTFSESNEWDFHLVVTEISGKVPATSEYFRRISEDLQTLPKFNSPQMFWNTFEHFRSFLKNDNFSVFWFR